MVETHGVAGDSKAQIRAAPHHGWATPLALARDGKVPSNAQVRYATGLEARKLLQTVRTTSPFTSPSRMDR